MTQTAMEIQSEIDKTDLRITELEMERERQTAAVAATEKAFIDGTADVAKLNDEQGKLSLYERTIESLRSSFQTLKSTFERQSSEERRGELLRQMTDAANSVPILVDDYLKTRSEFHEIIEKYATILVGKNEAYRVQQDLYRAIVSQLEPTGGEIQESGLEQKTLTMASATYFNHPPMGTFDEAVTLAENLLAAKLNRAAQAKRTAEYNAEKPENATV